MSKIFLTLFLCLQMYISAARGHHFADASAPSISYSLLADSGYALQQILANKVPAFTQGDSVRPYQTSVYWLRIIIANPGKLTGGYNLWMRPFIINTLYYTGAYYQNWLTSQAGLMLDNGLGRNQWQMAFDLQPRPFDTVYVKMDVSALKKFGVAIKPAAELRPKAVSDRRNAILWNGWLVAVSVLFFFFLYNLYLYLSLKHLSVLYYLVIQVGAIIYITTMREFMQVFFPCKLFSLAILKNGTVEYYDLNVLLQHCGILLVMCGFVQLTRSYINTQKYFARTDKLLKYGLLIYAVASVILMVINSCWVLLEPYTLLYYNIYLLLLISVIMYVAVAGYRKRLKASGAFLLANAIPLALMIGITLFNILVSTNADNDLWIPNLAIVSQAFCFAVALVARTRQIENTLEEKKLEARQLTLELKETELQHKIIVQEEKIRNGQLRQELEVNQRELASTTLYMLQKNELLATLKTQLKALKSTGNKQGLPSINSILQSNLYLDDDWGKFKLHFEKVHPLFFEILYAKHPTLTKNEIRLHAYFHMNLSTKEIAALLNIAPTSVRIAKARLLKKMGRPPEEDTL